MFFDGSVRSTRTISRSQRSFARARAPAASTSSLCGELVELGGVDRDRVRGDERPPAVVLDVRARSRPRRRATLDDAGSCRASARVWKPTTSLASSPSWIARAHRLRQHASSSPAPGHGMWTKCESSASGPRGRTIARREVEVVVVEPDRRVRARRRAPRARRPRTLSFTRAVARPRVVEPLVEFGESSGPRGSAAGTRASGWRTRCRTGRSRPARAATRRSR